MLPGLTLTRSHTVILLDRPWTPGDTAQAEDRVRRIGQVTLLYIIALYNNHLMYSLCVEYTSFYPTPKKEKSQINKINCLSTFVTILVIKGSRKHLDRGF